ncbi:DNA modification methylase [Streptococcus dysgalactiae]|uniref:Methyltransferase n=1 Tax=Streptococcus dysgalactiae TaxID=1334 RepID=A0ABU0A6Y3_STRDY|nr:DNA modification methylase [Streptococcus dysgalactiae]EGL48935.1 DNA (cytosine-5-)-methyltransferase [Streptococcus dysgalactiae subsp. equisimilis SK1249]MDQ0263051.1 site-specific DNA-methyltransferase (adenine-specific) [Streptococcus dysgalactiae]QQC56018.1 ParB N-terminal domain-containing protein [Streptococcus dysgalactiae]SUN70589.1 adenine methyltransferase [Streptococcus dysgalactiae]
MEFVDKKLSEITPYKNNPRNNDEAVGPVAESIKEFGFKVPIVIDKNGEIVNGHTRYKAAKKLGLETVPVIVADDLSEEQIKAFRLADNKVGEIAVWDLDLLNEELNDILDLDMSAFGFDVLDNLDDLIEDEKDLDEFTEAVPDEPKSKLGDIYQLGSHKLMCGDSTNEADVKKLMNGEMADLLLTDPPYNVAYEGKTKDSLTIKNDSMDNDSFRQFLVNAFSSANEVMKPGAVFYIWHADSEGYNFRGACFDIGWTVRQCLIWNKNSMVLGRQDYHWKHEPCLYGWKDGAGHLWASDRKQTTVIDYEKPQRNGVHPTMKPVGLFDYQIKNNTKGSDIVLDLFGGSGTTLIACESNGRHARLMEYDPKYVDVIINRWEGLTGDKAIKLN